MQTPNVEKVHPPLEADEDDTPTVKRIVESNEEQPLEELDLEEAEDEEEDPEEPNVFVSVGWVVAEKPLDPNDVVLPEDLEPVDEVTQELDPACIQELEEAAASS